MRTGIGWDRHRLVEGRPCVLGGVLFADALAGPLGHSDGDAATHAVIDALLGAAALGDIGRRFPDTDPSWAGADSLDLLRRTVALLSAEGWRVGNVDLTVIVERPAIAPRADAMAAALAPVLGVSDGDVSIKATRGEGLGPEGRGDCVTCLAVAAILPYET